MTDVLILNSLVLDLRGPEFGFADDLVGPGGLAKCPAAEMPDYTDARFDGWIAEGRAAAGGPGNTAPLLARAGIKVAVGGYLGRGSRGGLDVQGRAFHDILTQAGVDMSSCETHPSLPTATTFIHDAPGDERGGIAYFPNANDDFDFDTFKPHVKRLRPSIVYYMYSGLSERGDANGGRDLAAFMAWCRDQGALTIADSHTLTADPQRLIRDGSPVAAYRLLAPLLPTLDIFFTSADEAMMIENTLGRPRDWAAGDPTVHLVEILRHLLDLSGRRRERAVRLFGVTLSTGALAAYAGPEGTIDGPRMIDSRFMGGDVVDLVGAGDSFRAGLIAYIARNADAFRAGSLNLDEAIQMANLMASSYIRAPLCDRYRNIPSYDAMLALCQSE
mgnify:CR=1 FL=1